MGIESLKIFPFEDKFLKRLLNDERRVVWLSICIVYFIICFTEWTITRICKLKSYIYVIHNF